MQSFSLFDPLWVKYLRFPDLDNISLQFSYKRLRLFHFDISKSDYDKLLHVLTEAFVKLDFKITETFRNEYYILFDIPPELKLYLELINQEGLVILKV